MFAPRPPRKRRVTGSGSGSCEMLSLVRSIRQRMPMGSVYPSMLQEPHSTDAWKLQASSRTYSRSGASRSLATLSTGFRIWLMTSLFLSTYAATQIIALPRPFRRA